MLILATWNIRVFGSLCSAVWSVPLETGLFGIRRINQMEFQKTACTKVQSDQMYLIFFVESKPISSSPYSSEGGFFIMFHTREQFPLI